MSGEPLFEVGTPPPYNEQAIWAWRTDLKTKTPSKVVDSPWAEIIFVLFSSEHIEG